jgi:hypothetical protein
MKVVNKHVLYDVFIRPEFNDLIDDIVGEYTKIPRERIYQCKRVTMCSGTPVDALIQIPFLLDEGKPEEECIIITCGGQEVYYMNDQGQTIDHKPCSESPRAVSDDDLAKLFNRIHIKSILEGSVSTRRVLSVKEIEQKLRTLGIET